MNALQKYLAFLIVALIILIGLPFVFGQTKYDWLVLDHVETNMFSGCQYYNISNPMLSTGSFEGDNALAVDSFNLVKGSILDGRWQMYITKTCYYDEWQPNITCTPDIGTGDLEDGKNQTNSTQTCVDNGKYITKNKDCSEYQNIENDLTIMSQASLKVRYCADYQGLFTDKGYSVSIDMVPRFAGYTFEEYAWWNVSYTKRMLINCTNMTAGTPLVINGSSGFVLDGDNTSQIVWTYCTETDDTYLYYNNYSSYAIANGTAQLPHEIELGNGTSYNPTGVWYQYQAVYHLTNTSTIWHKDSTTSYDITEVGATNTTQAIGKIGKARKNDASLDALNRSNNFYDLTNDQPFKISWWAYQNVTSYHTNMAWWDIGYCCGQNGVYFRVDNSNIPHWHVAGGDTGTFDYSISIDNTWRHYTIIYYNDTDVSLFVNGVREANKTTNSADLSPYLFLFSSWNGDGSNSETAKYVGLDEFRFSNITTYTGLEEYNNAIATTGFGTLGAEELSNSAPSMSSITLTPSIVYTDTDLTAYSVYSDADLDNGTIYWQLYVNDTLNQTGENTSIVNGTDVSFTFDSDNYNVGDTLKVGVIAYDGTVNSSEVNSSEINVTSIPVITNVSILPNPAYANDTLIGTCNATAQPGYNLTYEYIWYLNGSYHLSYCHQETANVSTDCGGLSSGSYLVSGYWYDSFPFEIKNLYDADYSTYDYTNVGGESIQGQFYINYSKPQISLPESLWNTKNGDSSSQEYYNYSLPLACWQQTILQLQIESVQGASNYSCYNGTDWFFLGQGKYRIYEESMYWAYPYNTSNITDVLIKNQNWTFSCQANDSLAVSGWSNSSVLTISNRPPDTGTPVLSPTTAYKNTSQVNCTNSTTTDIDGDAVSFYYLWYLNWTSTGITTAYITNASYNHFDNLTCQIIPFDGTENGTAKNSSVLTISNTVPTTTTPTITPNPAFNNDTLTCNNATVNDIDGDTITFYYRWFRNNTNVTGITTTSTLSNTYFNKHDNMLCEIFAGDGYGNSTKYNSSVLTISNSPPVTVSVRINTTSNSTPTSLLEYCNVSDADGDTIKYYYIIYNTTGVFEAEAGTASRYTQSVETNIHNSSITYFGNYTLSCKGDDAETNSSWMNTTALQILGYYIESNTSDAWVYETENQTFTLLIENQEGDVNATFEYNNTSRTVTKTINEGNYTFTVNVLTPLINTNNTALAFRWNWTYYRNYTTTSSSWNSTQPTYFVSIPINFSIDYSNYTETQPVYYDYYYTNFQATDATISMILEYDGTNTTHGLLETSGSHTESNSASTGQNTNLTEPHYLLPYYQLVFDGQTVIRTPQLNQSNFTTFKIILESCPGTYSNTTGLRFNFQDFITSAPVNLTSGSGININYWYRNQSSYTRNLIYNAVNVSNYSLCFYPTWTTPYLTASYYLLAKANGYYDKTLIESNQVFNFTSMINRTVGMETSANNTQVNIHVLNNDDVPYTGYVVYQYKYNPLTNTSTLMSSAETDFTGSTTFSVSETDYYRFDVYTPNATQVYSTGNFKIILTDYYIRISDFLDPQSSSIIGLTGLSYTLTASNATGLCNYSWTDLYGLGQNFCLKVWDITQYNLTQVSFVCSANASGVLVYDTGMVGNHSFQCDAMFQSATNNLYYLLETKTISYYDNEGFGTDGLMLAFLIIGVAFFLGLWKPSVGIILGGITFILLTLTPIMNIPTFLIGGAILIISIVVASRMRD